MITGRVRGLKIWWIRCAYREQGRTLRDAEDGSKKFFEAPASHLCHNHAVEELPVHSWNSLGRSGMILVKAETGNIGKT